MMRFGSSESLLGVPDTRIVLPDGREQPATGLFLLVNSYGAGPSAFGWIMSGLPPMYGDIRTYDTVDTYIKQNSDRPLIGGFETLESYYHRLRDPEAYVRWTRETAERYGGPGHGFYPITLDALRRYRRDY